jgi:predicted lipid-binding transport protein (Tim44 family)
MLRTIFTIGLFTILGLVALKFALGLFGGLVGGLFGLFFWLLGMAIRVALVGLLVYAVVRLLSPETARRWRERFAGGR